MNQLVADEQIKVFLKKYRKYRLISFKHILQEMLLYYGALDALKGKAILELGPGTKLNLLRFLVEQSGAQSVTGIGRVPQWFWLSDKKALQDYVENDYILPRLKSRKAKSVDLIYSRHVMEEHSIHPLILLQNPVYRKSVKENRMANPGKDFPSSAANIQAIFKEAFRLMRPGGLMISQIGKKKNSVLNDDFIKSLRATKISIREIGRLSQIVTMQKK